jgi:carbon-monoxide dehydrogenase medium subunit
MLIDINRAPELARITVEGEFLRIGALVRMTQAEFSPEVRAACPLITEALRWVANPEVRNRATLVGNLVHAGRGSELPSVALALDAELVLESAAGGARRSPAGRFFRPDGTVDRDSGEFVTEVIFPKQPAGCGSAFVEVQRRSAHYALLGAGAALIIRSATIRDARVSLAGAAPGPIRCSSAERLLAGQAPSAELFSEAASVAARDGTRLAYDDLHATAQYRRSVAPELVARALFGAAKAAGFDIARLSWS